MNVKQRWKNIKYESAVDPEFTAEMTSTPSEHKILDCIQCGTCSGTCPVSHYMDLTPRKIIAMIRAGFKQEVLTSVTTWLCASCYSCTVECPQEIKITDVMYSLKRRAIREGVYPKRFPISVLAQEFYKSVMKSGRNNEARLTVRLFMKTNPWRLLGQATLGFKLWTQGRLRLKSDSIKNKRELTQLMRALDMEMQKRHGGSTAAATGEVL